MRLPEQRENNADAKGATSEATVDLTTTVAVESIFRLLAEVGALVAGMLASVVLARALGPDLKGDYSAIIYVVGVVAAVSTMGLGDANIVLISQQKASLNEAVRASTALVVAASLFIGIPILLGTLDALLHVEWRDLRDPVWAAAALVLLSSLSNLANTTLLATRNMNLSSGVLVGSSWVVASIVWLSIGVYDGAVGEALVASIIGALLVMGVVLPRLSREGWSVGWNWNMQYARIALRLGLPLQAAALLMSMSFRLDLLFVHALKGSASAGYYSVSLMMGQLVLYIPFALSLVTFPRLARSSSEEARRLGKTLFRISFMASSSVALVLAVLTPLAVPFVFGQEFTPAVGPGMLLVIGGVGWGQVWTLARAEAARGSPRTLFVSFGASLVIMILGDLALIPRWGLWGAALASSLAAFAGLLLCVKRLGRGEWQLVWHDLVPRWTDVLELFRILKKVTSVRPLRS